MPIFHRPSLQFYAPRDIAEPMRPLIARMLADNADGFTYRCAIRHWQWSERPVAERFIGNHNVLRIDGPQLDIDGHKFPMGGMINGPAGWAKLDPIDLEPRVFLDRHGAEFTGFASRANIEIERKMLDHELAGRGAVAPIASQLDAHRAVARAATVSTRNGHGWIDEQRTATVAMLTSRNRVTGLQGYAGTAKTSTVLAAVAAEANARGYAVSAFAPTAAAAMVLGDALGARHLLTGARGGGKPSLWIVDEASLLSARDTAKLFEQAENQNARIVLVGDVKQLGSVEAGAAFAQLQGAGMETAKLGVIVRQTNSATKEAVMASIAGDAVSPTAEANR